MANSYMHSKQIKVDYGTSPSNYSTLQEMLSRKVVDRLPFNATQAVTFAGTAVMALDDSMISGDLAVGTSSTTVNGGILVALGTGNKTTAEVTAITSPQGIFVNKVDVRDSVTNDPIVDTDGRRVFGLLQAVTGTADGAAIGASGSENLKLTLVKLDSTDTIVTVSYTGEVEFQVNKLYSELTLPNFRMNGGLIDMDVVQTPAQVLRTLVVTGSFAANEVITISTGAGSVSGTASSTGATITLPSSSSSFNALGNVRVYRNGSLQHKGSGNDIVWVSTTTFQFTESLDVGEVIIIEAPNSY